MITENSKFYIVVRINVQQEMKI